MGPDKLIIFNPLHGHDQKHPPLGEQYLPVTDGAMVYDFDRAANIRQQSKEYMANTLNVMRKAAPNQDILDRYTRVTTQEAEATDLGWDI